MKKEEESQDEVMRATGREGWEGAERRRGQWVKMEEEEVNK